MPAPRGDIHYPYRGRYSLLQINYPRIVYNCSSDRHKSQEGVSQVLICFPREEEREKNPDRQEWPHGAPGPALSSLSQHGCCTTWHGK
jgi:hypothetical protein